MSATKPGFRIDFVSDISCPWCAIGLGALEQALRRLQDTISVELRFQPFELNPHMGPEGQDLREHLAWKYGSSAEQQAMMRARIRDRGVEVGFDFNPAGRGRIWNTFDAHRLLHLAAVEEPPGAQSALKHALLAACHTHCRAMSDHGVLTDCARQAGLDEIRVRTVLDGEEFACAVRERQTYYTDRGIHAVPAVIIDDRHLISGGQPSAVYEQVLLQMAEARAKRTTA